MKEIIQSAGILLISLWFACLGYQVFSLTRSPLSPTATNIIAGRRLSAFQQPMHKAKRKSVSVKVMTTQVKGPLRTQLMSIFESSRHKLPVLPLAGGMALGTGIVLGVFGTSKFRPSTCEQY